MRLSLMHRLHLSDKWALIVAVGLLMLSVLYCGGSLYLLLGANIDHLIYPLVAVRENTGSIFTIVILVAFLGIEIWASAIVPYRWFMWVALLAIVLSIFFLAVNWPAGLIVTLCTVFGITKVANNYSVRLSCASFVMLLAVGLITLFVVGTIYFEFHHVDDYRTTQYVYNLALVYKSNLDCVNYFIVYQCDSFGIVCNSIYRTKDTFECFAINQLSEKSYFILDPADNALYVQIGDERTLIAP